MGYPVLYYDDEGNEYTKLEEEDEEKQVLCCNSEGEDYWTNDSNVHNEDRVDRESHGLAIRRKISKEAPEADDHLY